MDSPFWIYLITCESVLVFWGFVRVEKKREEEKVFFVSLFRSFLKKKKKKNPKIKITKKNSKTKTTDHVGLFVCLTLAQIGVQGRKQGYF